MNLNITIWSLFLLIGTIQALILCFIFLTQKKGNRKANLIFSSLLLIFAIILFDHSLRLSQLYKFFPQGLYISDSIWYLIAPLLWIYLKIRLGNNKFRLIETLHFVPFLYFFYTYRGMLFLNSKYKAAILESYVMHGSVHNFLIKVFILIMMIQMLIYLIICFNFIYKYEKRFKDFFSSNQADLLTTLKRIFLFFTLYFIFEFAFSTYRNFANIQNRFIENWSLVMWTLFILILSYTIVKSPKLIFESIAEPKRRKQKYEGLDFFEIEKELLSYIETSKPFLDNNLTLPQLAKSIKLTPHQLSFALNTHLKTTFYDFVNTYRVKYAAQLLESGEHLKLSIFGVAQVSGFKSKASFYSFFKKQFNTTPSKFIEKL